MYGGFTVNDLRELKAVVGINAWGSSAYEKMLRGSAVDESTLKAPDEMKELHRQFYGYIKNHTINHMNRQG